MAPEHEGQDSGDPFRSLAMRFRACAGLYEAGRGLRMDSPEENQRAVIYPARVVDHARKLIRSRLNPKWLASIGFQPVARGSSRIRLRHSAGPDSWTLAPLASTATVTGIWSTVNS